MPFERFKEIGRSFAPKASFRKNGQIGFSQGAVKRFRIGEYKYCGLYFDKEEEMIGLEFKNEDDGMVASVFNKRNNCYIAAKTFLDYYNIDYGKTKSFLLNKDDNSGLIVIDSKKPQK